MKAAIYARQSIEKADSVSIDAQVERCRAVCAVNGWDAEVYSDAGFSGKNIERPAFERLLNGVQKGAVKAIVSYKLDRISRSITDFANLLQLFDKHGVQYVSATEQFDTSTPVGRAMIYIVMVFAQLERETITQRVSDNYRFRAAKGLYMGGNVPLGYTSRKIILDGRRASELALDPLDSELVKKIFNGYLGGYNTHQLATKLNAEGAGTSKGRLFSYTAIARILQNITYCSNAPDLYAYLIERGYSVYNELSTFDGKHGMCCFFKNHDKNKPTAVSEQLAVIGRHEPIIEARDWIAVQRMMNLNSDNLSSGNHSPKRSSRSWLAGLVKCADCGYSFGLKYTQKASGQYAYYYCRGRSTHGEGSCSNDLWIPAQELESRIEELLRNHAEKILQAGIHETSAKPAENDTLIRLRQALVACDLQIKNIMENLGKGNEIVDRHISDYITTLDSKRSDLQRQIARTEVQAFQDTARAMDAEYLQEASRSVLNAFSGRDIDERAHLARLFIERVSISKNGSIITKWTM